MQRKINIMALVLLTFISLSPFVLKVNAESVKENAQNRLNQFIENRCEIVSLNIDNRINRYNTNKQRHVERYTEIKNKIAETLTKLETQGIDVTGLREDLKMLDSMIIEFAQTYTKVIEQLEFAKTYACGDSEGQFREAVQAAQQNLISARNKAADIITFIRTTIKTDLQNLRDSLN